MLLKENNSRDVSIEITKLALHNKDYFSEIFCDENIVVGDVMFFERAVTAMRKLGIQFPQSVRLTLQKDMTQNRYFISQTTTIINLSKNESIEQLIFCFSKIFNLQTALLSDNRFLEHLALILDNDSLLINPVSLIQWHRYSQTVNQGSFMDMEQYQLWNESHDLVKAINEISLSFVGYEKNLNRNNKLFLMNRLENITEVALLKFMKVHPHILKINTSAPMELDSELIKKYSIIIDNPLNASHELVSDLMKKFHCNSHRELVVLLKIEMKKLAKTSEPTQPDYQYLATEQIDKIYKLVYAYYKSVYDNFQKQKKYVTKIIQLNDDVRIESVFDDLVKLEKEEMKDFE